MNCKKVAVDNLYILFHLYCSLVEQYKQSEIPSLKERALVLENKIDNLRGTCLEKAIYIESDKCSLERADLISQKLNAYIRIVMIKIQDNYPIDVLNILSQLNKKLDDMI